MMQELVCRALVKEAILRGHTCGTDIRHSTTLHNEDLSRSSRVAMLLDGIAEGKLSSEFPFLGPFQLPAPLGRKG